MGIDSEDPLPAEGALSTKQVRAFLKGEPKTLGAIQIIIGVLTLCLSVTLLQEPIHFLGDVKVLIVVFVQLTLSGSAFVHAGRKPSLFWVKTSLVLNLVSAAFSTAALGLLSKHVPYRQYSYHCEHCRKLENYAVIMIEGVVGTLILFLVLELLICITGMLYGLSVLANGALQVTAGTRVVTIPNIRVQAPPQAPPQASPQAPPQVVVQAPPQVVVQAPPPRPASPPSEPQVEPVEEANMP
ncbi:membrane-spanning 4-domains subfamily A member 15-like isoform X2 [Anguilla anguilla]|uniref:membrane-spanning 4-domains subfamily A member 15-like isoform X2 n=1 Tax=Anguilla anguilla TaxID=7936 RepID=UPI0015A7A47A|nr:membrane-spanning 4-domains subfamily A member 15-like isoform X2 [Anguilla anguilla]